MMTNRELIEAVLQQGSRRPQLHRGNLQSNDEAGGHIRDSHKPPVNTPALRKGEGKVQEERRLQSSGNDIAPEDNLIQRV